MTQQPDRPAPSAPVRPGRRWPRWLALAAAALALLALSEVIWQWQSWPVRRLVETAPARGPAL